MELRTFGAGGMDVVLFHGTPTPPEHMQPLAERLAARRRVHVVVIPGYGGTPPAPSYAWEDLHAAMLSAFHERGVRQPVLVGFSGGALHALGLGLRRASGARGIVALSGCAERSASEREELRAFARHLRAGAQLQDLMPGRMLSPAWVERPDAVAEVKGWLAAAPAEVLAAELEAAASMPNLLPLLRELQVPLLARVGALDVIHRPALSQAMAKAASRGAAQVVPGVGHALLLEDAEGTAAAIEVFLSELP